MTIRTKMLILSLAVIIGFLVVIAGTVVSIDGSKDASNTFAQRSGQIRRALEIKASAFATIQLDPTAPETAKIFADSEKNIDKNGGELVSLAQRPASRDAIKQVLALWKQYDQDSQALLTLAKTDAKAANDQLLPLYNKEFTPLKAAIESFVDGEGRDTDEAMVSMEANQSHVLWLVIVPLAILGVALVIFVALLSRDLALTLKRVFAALDQLGEGDLTMRLPEKGKDELAQISQAVNAFVGQTRAIVQQVQGGSQQVSVASSELCTSATQIATGSTLQSEAASAMAASIEEMSVSVSSVANNASEALVMARSSRETSQEGSLIIRSAVDEMNKIADAVKVTASTIETLGQQSQQISAIVQVIKDIADQTNLLALNAAIEAARAGEQGRGFAVVADEVRKLAERTTQSTQEIAAMIGKIQVSTQDAVAHMGTVVVNVGSGQTLADQAGNRIGEIQGSVERVMAEITQISAALSQQSTASQDIAGNVEHVAQMTDENSSAAKTAAQAAGYLEQIAKEMRQTVNHFKV
ncbi:MAG: methyl-accepting chemotaxis protein [Burkholderiales bacterium]|nr:methyl-accepting chemotaxis protein [Burkholderiales bacterium]